MTTAHHGVRYAVITVGTSGETERRVTAPSDSGVSVVFEGLGEPVPGIQRVDAQEHGVPTLRWGFSETYGDLTDQAFWDDATIHWAGDADPDTHVFRLFSRLGTTSPAPLTDGTNGGPISNPATALQAYQQEPQSDGQTILEMYDSFDPSYEFPGVTAVWVEGPGISADRSQFFPIPLDRQTVSFQCQLACEERVLWAVPMIEWGVPDPGDPESTLVVGTETVGPPLSFGQVTGDAAWAQMDFTYPVASNATLWRPRLMLYALDPTIDHDTIPGATYVSRPMAVQQDIDTLEPITFAAPADFPHGDNDIATFDISAYPNPEGWSINIFFTAEGAHASTGDSSGATDVGTEYPDFSTDGTVSQTLNVIYSSAAPVDFVAQQGDGGQITISGAAAGDHLTAVGGPDTDAFNLFASLFVNSDGEQIQTDATIYEWWVETTIGGSEPNFRPPDGTEILIDCIYVPENGLSVADQPYLDGDQSYGIWEGEPHASTSLLGVKVPGPDAFDPTVVLPDSLII